MAAAAVTSLLDVLAQQPLTDSERKGLYDASLRLAYSVESTQDTAQRLYHGVGLTVADAVTPRTC